MKGMPNIATLKRNLISYFRIVQPFLGMDLDLDDDVYIYQVDAKKSVENYELYEVYKIHKRGEPILNKIGGSTSQTDCCNFVYDGKNIRRHDLRVS